MVSVEAKKLKVKKKRFGKERILEIIDQHGR